MQKGILKNPGGQRLENLQTHQIFALLAPLMSASSGLLLESSERRSRQRRLVSELVSDRRLQLLKKGEMLTVLRQCKDVMSEQEVYSLVHRLINRLEKLSSLQLFAFFRACPFNTEKKQVLVAIYRRSALLDNGELLQLMEWLFPPVTPSAELKKVVQLLKQRAQRDIGQRRVTAASVFGLVVCGAQGNTYHGSMSMNNCFCDGCGEQRFRGPRYRCTVCPDFDLCAECFRRLSRERDAVIKGRHTFGHAMSIVSMPMQVFRDVSPPPPSSSSSSAAAATSRAWVLDVQFSDRCRQQLAELQPKCMRANSTPGATDAALVLLRDMPRGTAAKIYVSLEPYTEKFTHFVGAIFPNRPFLGIEWARLLLGFWKLNETKLVIPSLRIGIRLGPIDHVEQKIRNGDGLAPAAALPSIASALPNSIGSPSSSSSSASSPASSASSSSSIVAGSPGGNDSMISMADGVIVCNGEVQHFTVNHSTTFGDLLNRSAKRWQLHPADYELQDLEFAAFDPNRRVLDAFTSLGAPIVRLAPKGATSTFNSSSQSSDVRFASDWS
jgi:Zinc finger, ZZ type